MNIHVDISTIIQVTKGIKLNDEVKIGTLIVNKQTNKQTETVKKVWNRCCYNFFIIHPKQPASQREQQWHHFDKNMQNWIFTLHSFVFILMDCIEMCGSFCVMYFIYSSCHECVCVCEYVHYKLVHSSRQLENDQPFCMQQK